MLLRVSSLKMDAQALVPKADDPSSKGPSEVHRHLSPSKSMASLITPVAEKSPSNPFYSCRANKSLCQNLIESVSSIQALELRALDKKIKRAPALPR